MMTLHSVGRSERQLDELNTATVDTYSKLRDDKQAASELERMMGGWSGTQKARAAQTGSLEVHIVRAKNLVAKDRNGFSDPYVQVHLGQKKHRTKTLMRTLNPEWNQKFVFKAGRGEQAKNLGELVALQPLLLRVWDYDRGSDGDALGELPR